MTESAIKYWTLASSHKRDNTVGMPRNQNMCCAYLNSSDLLFMLLWVQKKKITDGEKVS